MRFLARAVAILCLSTVVSCSKHEDAPTRPSSPQSPAEGTVQISVLDREGGAMTLDVYFRRIGEDGSPMGEPTKFVAGPDAEPAKLPVGDYYVILAPPSNTGYPATQIPSVHVKEGANRLDHQYSGTRIEGATASAGTPLSSVNMSLHSDGKIYLWQVSREGRYAFTVPPGSYILQALPSILFHEGLSKQNRSITITDEDVTHDFDFLGYETQVLVTVKGEPAAYVFVNARGADATVSGRTDGSGSVTRFLLAGDYSLDVTGVPGVVWPWTFQRSITAPGTVPLDLAGATWDVTLRWRDDLSPVLARIGVKEVGSTRGGYIDTDEAGRIQMVMQHPERPHEVVVFLPGRSTSFPVAASLSSTGDATFDLLVDGPPAP
jgi:hypothetical protein